METKKRIREQTAFLLSKGWVQYLLALLITGVALLLCLSFRTESDYHLFSFILLFVVSFLSTFLGTGPVLLASALSALAWDYFFIPPHNTFKIDRSEDILIFGLFFVIVVVSGVLTTRVRRQELLARERERKTNALFLLTRDLSKASGMDEVIRVATEGITTYFSPESVFILREGDARQGAPVGLARSGQLPESEFQIAQWVFTHSRKAGTFTSQPFDSRYTWYPLTGSRLNPGVVALVREHPFETELNTFWEAFITLASNAIEREFLAESAQMVRFLHESDRLYKTLFNSISHELRIPVATIMGASDTMANTTVPRKMQTALSREIFTASLRLNRLIENLLNMSRIESGHITPRTNWHDINDLINKVAGDLADELKPFSLKVEIVEEMPLVKMDFGLMEQVLYNLVYNATQYAPPASEITIRCHYLHGNLVLEVCDQGPGFPENELRDIFRKFYRGKGSHTGGLGLGLSIVKGFVSAHNGTISAANRPGGGAVFTLIIPSERPDITGWSSPLNTE
ncbi:MAG: DUF4118 domain-containing protein [Prolixibacteraceae bacterium]|jgi:two-component system sensor histidine kinase KdpD|nr:DUF4118 domain-containing protein [Prolixibacteraceae bacterium]NLX28887.1 DUF4118 domain-containing protein [Bacteroidales bacterium]